VTSVNVGKTTVYSYTDNAWERIGNVIEDGTIEKRNGFSISLSNDGTTIAVGSENGGGVRIYRFRSKSWIPFGTHISGTFGKSVALSGNTVVIGSEAENNGRVYIYTYGGDDWSLLGDTFEKVIVAEGGTVDMGKFVTISDDRTLLSVVSQSDIRVYSI
jgi:WD40 repeat protein